MGIGRWQSAGDENKVGNGLIGTKNGFAWAKSCTLDKFSAEKEMRWLEGGMGVGVGAKNLHIGRV